MQVSNNFSLHSLMPHNCNLSRIDSYTVSTQYGLVGFQSKTSTEKYFPQGKYYHSIDEYDKHCTCPYTRTFTWNPEANWTTLYSSEFLQRTNRMEVIQFKTLQKLDYRIPFTARDQFYEMGEIDVIENIYLKEISAILPIIISSFYETSIWVKWKLQVTHNLTENYTKPCTIQQDNLLISFSEQLPQNQLPLCNASDFLKIQIVNKDTTKIIIPGGKFRTISQKQKRSLIHLGIGNSNIFHWENWQMKNTIKTPTNYILTIINGPIRKQKKVVHFSLENIQSHLMTIPDALIHKNLQPEDSLIAYHKGEQYCERVSSAKIDMHNVKNINQKSYENCYKYHNNTETCQKMQEPHCKYAVGSIKTALQKPGILPDMAENKPSIAYTNACFLPSNYTVYGNATEISEPIRTKREVTLAAVVLISVLMGALVAGIIETQLMSYNRMINEKLEELESRFTLQFNQIENQVSELQTQQIELAKAIATLSRVAADLANRQHRFETYILAFNEQLLKQQIVTTRRSIENRKLILSQNAYETQIALKEYNSRKLILQTLKTLKNIPSLKNDTIYRNQILNGVIQNTEIYKIIKQGEHNLTLWRQRHPLTIRNQSIRLEQLNRMKEVLKNEDNYDKNIGVLQEIATISVKPIEIIEFTNEYKPILFPGADVGLGISGIIKTASDTGIRILETGTTLVKDVVSQGLNVVSGPIK